MKQIVLCSVLIILSLSANASINNGTYICEYKDLAYNLSEILILDLKPKALTITYTDGEVVNFADTKVKMPVLIDNELSGYYTLTRSSRSIRLNQDKPADLCRAENIGECDNIEDEVWNSVLKYENNKIVFVVKFSSQSRNTETYTFTCQYSMNQ